jgi:UDP-glucose 4-epimerase
MKIVVTGAAGFIGGHLIEQLTRDGNDCLGMDDMSIHQGNTPEWILNNEQIREKILHVDCVVYKKTLTKLNAFKPDVIFNLAVKPLEHSIELPENNFRTNTLITMNVLSYIRRHKTKLIHFSSSEVYGSAYTDNMSEEHRISPNTTYAASKAACDHAVLSYVRTFEADAMIVRPFNTIGPRQNDRTYAAIIPKTTRRIKEGKCPMINGSGNNTRDYTAVEDIVNGAIATMNLGKRGEVYNLCSGEETSTREMMDMISKEMKYFGEYDYTIERQGDVKRHRGDNTKAQNELGWKPNVNIREAVRRAIHD